MSSQSKAPEVATDEVVSIGGQDFVLVGHAAKRLGISHNSVLRRLKIGALKGFTDHVNGYHYVNVRSIDETIKLREELARAASLPGDERFRSDAEIDQELKQALA